MANTPSEKASILPVSPSCPPLVVTGAPSSSLPGSLYHPRVQAQCPRSSRTRKLTG